MNDNQYDSKDEIEENENEEYIRLSKERMKEALYEYRKMPMETYKNLEKERKTIK
jgi:hypothetical protein